ncbi:hypothetical protein OU798_02985 [Prolixibacteraceae bacterium Z1-6]|uniref:Uncharacterized protein n=1 Tax=Draconibacterium aestuarii TaxID=2998507 RepID=A0A9X3F3U3_9BACT|nr:hypothetical protein [Prolixibacteraceae bacterium Z1-6]
MKKIPCLSANRFLLFQLLTLVFRPEQLTMPDQLSSPHKVRQVADDRRNLPAVRRIVVLCAAKQMQIG